VQKRRRVKHIASLEDRLAYEAHRLKEQARKLPLGSRRDALQRKAGQAENAAHICEWLTSPSLASPK
jgi:hypothetical protein